MATYGLRVRDENTGAELINSTDSLTRFLLDFDSGTSNGDINVAGLSLGRGFAAAINYRPPTFLQLPPRVYIDGSWVRWRFDVPTDFQPASVRIIVGLW